VRRTVRAGCYSEGHITLHPVTSAVRDTANSDSFPLGIGIVTRNRLSILQQTVAEVVRLTGAPHTLVIADDGSEDGTAEWARSQRIPVVAGPRRGCAWNKNRALYYLETCTDCAVLLLFEDDTRPIGANWEREWIAAGLHWQHVNYCYGFERANPPPGSGTAEDPYRCLAFGGHCTVTARDALRQVGYLDTRFRGYGWEHVEWTWRFELRYGPQWGFPDGSVPCLDHAVTASWPPSFFDQQEVDTNGAIYTDIRAAITGPYYRGPWRDDDGRLALQGEVDRARHGRD
jgi:glycosyltransferase involved in cell wall biosynthesis